MKKKWLILIMVVTGLFLVYLFFIFFSDSKYVKMKNGRFHLDGKFFFPVAINYMASIKASKDLIWASPYGQYYSDNEFEIAGKAACRNDLMADMELIKELGFNTVRIVVFGEEKINKNTGEIFIYANLGNHIDTVIFLSDKASYDNYLRGFSELVEIVNSTGLKAILLIPVHPGLPASEEHFKKVASHFYNESTIIAYDLFNEPLYFDTLERTKIEVFSIVRNWKQMMRDHAPNQLFTLGLTGIREIFEWDPNLLDVDFISFHPYEYEPDQVRNEIVWYSRHVKKTWMIGETGISADDENISYEIQKEFAKKTLVQACNCDAIGYSWWQYKDVDKFYAHQNHLGIVNKKGTTKTQSGKVVKGTPKPVAKIFENFNFFSDKDSCVFPENYFNYSSKDSFRITGELVDLKNQPIEGGVVLAWNQTWTHSYHTITKHDGSFELRSNYPFYHWMASATMFSRTHAPVFPDSAIFESGIPTIDVGKIQIERVSLPK